MTRHGLDWREIPGMVEARRLLKARRGKATEADRPDRPSTPKRQIPGQLDLFGSGNAVNEAQAVARRTPDA